MPNENIYPLKGTFPKDDGHKQTVSVPWNETEQFQLALLFQEGQPFGLFDGREILEPNRCVFYGTIDEQCFELLVLSKSQIGEIVNYKADIPNIEGVTLFDFPWSRQDKNFETFMNGVRGDLNRFFDQKFIHTPEQHFPIRGH